MSIEFWGLLGTILALIPIFSYIVSRFYYNPKVLLTLGGQQSGTPIPLPSPKDKMWIGISTKSDKNVLIKEVLVQYNPQYVEILSKEATLTPTLLQDYTTALQFSGSWVIKRKYNKVFVVGYKVKGDVKLFTIKIVVYAKVDEAEIPFPWDMLPPKIHKHQSILHFKVENFKGNFNEKIKRYGYSIAPKEGIIMGYTMERKT